MARRHTHVYPRVYAVVHLRWRRPGQGRCALLQAKLIRSSNRRYDRHVAHVFAEPMGADLMGSADAATSPTVYHVGRRLWRAVGHEFALLVGAASTLRVPDNPRRMGRLACRTSSVTLPEGFRLIAGVTDSPTTIPVRASDATAGNERT
jgi:hypothetical protein